MDWLEWHGGYDRPESWLALRLRVVQEWIGSALRDAPAGPLKVLSMCAGQGRDLLEVLADHPRRDDVRARLVESLAQEFAAVIGLDSRHEERFGGVGHVLYTNLPEDLVAADAIFVLTRRGADMEALAPHVSPGTVIADDTHPEMPASLRARLEERGASVF